MRRAAVRPAYRMRPGREEARPHSDEEDDNYHHTVTISVVFIIIIAKDHRYRLPSKSAVPPKRQHSAPLVFGQGHSPAQSEHIHHSCLVLLGWAAALPRANTIITLYDDFLGWAADLSKSSTVVTFLGAEPQPRLKRKSFFRFRPQPAKTEQS